MLPLKSAFRPLILFGSCRREAKGRGGEVLPPPPEAKQQVAMDFIECALLLLL